MTASSNARDALDAIAAPASGLASLEARLREDLAWLDLPAPAWVPPREADGQTVLDVAIIGAGMAGLALAAELKLLGIARIQCFDAAPQGFEGPWLNHARMLTLRSPKQLAGPALRLPALTFRAWYEAQFGREQWQALYKIPRAQWMDYLGWYRAVLDLPVRNATRLAMLHPREDGWSELEFELESREDGLERQRVIARHVVLATGREGTGGPALPALAARLPQHLYAHSSAPIDFAALRGKRVGVVGAGASAFDNAASALEAGASRVDLFVRRPALPGVNKLTGIGSPGLVHGFEKLADDWKWRFLHYAGSTQTPPPRDSVLRVARHENAHLHLRSPLTSLAHANDTITLGTPRAAYSLDYLIFATGFHSRIDTRPEFAAIAPHVRRWRDRADLRDGLANTLPSEELEGSPDLDANFAFQAREPGACAALAHIHCFNHAASLSHGKVAGDIPAIGDGAQRLARAIASMLFDADREQHYAALVAFDKAELLGDEWSDADDDTSAPAATSAAPATSD